MDPIAKQWTLAGEKQKCKTEEQNGVFREVDLENSTPSGRSVGPTWRPAPTSAYLSPPLRPGSHARASISKSSSTAWEGAGRGQGGSGRLSRWAVAAVA